MSTKKYYWLKLKDDFFDDDTIRFIEEQENGIAYSNFYLKLCLKSIRSEGKLIRYIGETVIPYDIPSLSRLTGVNCDTVRSAMQLFERIGIVKVLETGEIYLSQINEMIGSETDKAILMRKKRALDKIGNNVTKALPECYTDIYIEKDIDKEIDKDIEIKKEKKETYVSILDSYTTNQELKESLKAFIDMRKKMKGYTVNAFKLNLKTLNKVANNDLDKIKVVDQSVENSWKTFYELKKENKKQEYTFTDKVLVL